MTVYLWVLFGNNDILRVIETELKKQSFTFIKKNLNTLLSSYTFTVLYLSTSLFSCFIIHFQMIH